jgi:hypothetical protein
MTEIAEQRLVRMEVQPVLILEDGFNDAPRSLQRYLGARSRGATQSHANPRWDT